MQPPLKLFSICMLLLCVVTPARAGKSTQNFYDLGVFAYEEGRYAESEDHFLKALALDPENARANYYLGQMYLKMAKPDQAERYLTRAFSLEPEVPGLRYSLGMLFYNQEKFHQAAQKFQEAAADDPSNVLAIYYAGISLYRLEQFDAAVLYLAKSARMSPSIEANAGYYSGVCYYQAGRLDEAAAQFARVIEIADDRDLEENAEVWAKAVRNKQAGAAPYHLYLKTGYLYDDNVVLEPADRDIIADESDSALWLYFNGSYNVVDTGRWTSGIGYSHYQTRYKDLDEYDLTGGIGNVFAGFKFSESVMLDLRYLPAYYWVDAESYLMQHQLKPSLRWTIDTLNAIDFSYSYFRNNYFTGNSRDGHANELTADYSRGFSGLDGYVFCGIGYEVNSASDKDQDYAELKTLAGISWDIADKTNITVYGNFYDKAYDNKDSTYNIKRDDTRYYVCLSLTRTLWKPWLAVGAEYSFTKNNSSIAEFDYERNAILLSASVKL